MRDGPERAELLSRLRGVIAQCGPAEKNPDSSVVPAGWAALRRLLPRGGLRRGSLVELLSTEPGGGAETVAAVLTRDVCCATSAVLVVDPARAFYAPAVPAWGVPLRRLIPVHAA